VAKIAPAIPSADTKRPVIVHAPSSRRRKGTEHVVAAVEGLDADIRIVEGLTHDEAFELYREADIVVDQLNAGWYGVFAIEAMALGKPVVTFLHDEAVRRTEEAFGLPVPIVGATKESLRDALRPLVDSPDERRRVGAASRAYAEEVHDVRRMADRLLALYAGLQR
jgi:glycosyltransferase involved in cell wall biosynthesis